MTIKQLMYHIHLFDGQYVTVERISDRHREFFSSEPGYFFGDATDRVYAFKVDAFYTTEYGIHIIASEKERET